MSDPRAVATTVASAVIDLLEQDVIEHRTAQLARWFACLSLLLMIAIGLAAAAIAAHSGVAMPAQLFTAALVGGAAVMVCYRVRLRKVGAPSVRADRSVNLDIGETVHIEVELKPDDAAPAQ